MSVQKLSFGRFEDGREVTLYRLQNASGAHVDILDYGLTIQALCVPDRSGKLVDVVQGYESAGEYATDRSFMGCTVGRVGNRISGARFTLNGKEYAVSKNEGENCLHGGFVGFGRRFWTGEIQGEDVVFTLFSPDGEEGFPGNLTAKVRCSFGDDCALTLDYTAVSDADTVVNLTNHSYFNLAGGGTILNHELKINASAITETDAALIPTGRLLPVEGTPFDFRTPKPIGRDIDAEDVNIRYAGGYDHNFAVDGEGFRETAQVYSPESGICMAVYSDAPGVQLYTSNMVPGTRKGKGGVLHAKRTMFCMETQNYPDAINRPEFPNAVLKAGETYHTRTVYQFGVR